MRVIVIGAAGRVGRAILRGVAEHPQVTHVVSLTESTSEPWSRESETPIEQRKVDLFDDLSEHFKFADAAVYAGWPVSELPVRSRTRQMDSLGNICQSIGVVGVRVFVYGSSAGVYASAPPGQAVDEAWPTLESTPSLHLSHLVRGEQIVSAFEDHHPLIRVVRLRTGVIVCPARDRPATIGKILRVMNAPQRRRFVPDFGPYALQCVHVDDFVNALCLALTQSVNGPFNIAADPITSDLLAELFAAKKLRVPPQYLRRILLLGSRLRVLRRVSDWVELAVRSQVIDTTRARKQLDWTIQYPARSIVAEWTEAREPVSVQPGIGDASDTVDASAATMDLGSLYAQGLAYFGERVHAIPDDQWKATTGRGLNAWQLVATVALDQYRVAHVARGDDSDTIESQLPGDPLGIAPKDGWDLAAERGLLAVTPPDGLLRQENDSLAEGLTTLLPGVLSEILRGAAELERVLGIDTAVPHELARFAELRKTR